MQQLDKRQPAKNQNARDHLANERTFLAWIRTSIGIMGFGFVVVKFSLFIRQVSGLLGKEIGVHKFGYSSVTGILLVVAGAVVLLLSFIKYKQTERQLLEETYQHSSGLIFTLTAVIFVISIFMVFYLVESSFHL